jgi:plasmid stability protein
MKNLTIRDVPSDLAKALEKEKTRRGKSLNQTVLQLLSQCLGVRSTSPRRNGLARLAGTWTAEEYNQFEQAIATSEQIDEELWR